MQNEIQCLKLQLVLLPGMVQNTVPGRYFYIDFLKFFRQSYYLTALESLYVIA
ncbi:MAG: hypothetical protein JSV42_10925 [Chloroflexota bacterium]|nr:MAG: hypothetical protein JSV42_10925 [Chloroflexota bacterium]